MKTPFLVSTMLSIALAGLLGGCNVVPPPQADSTRYFVLTDAGPPPPKEGAGTLTVGIRTVELPAYLKTEDIVVRRSENEISSQESARWAEPLAAGIARVVRAELDASPAVNRTYQQPFPLDAPRDNDVAIRILRCEGDIPKSGRPAVRFEAAIEITGPNGEGGILAHRVFVAPEQAWDGSDFGRLAELISADAAALGREAASALTSAQPQSAPAH